MATATATRPKATKAKPGIDPKTLDRANRLFHLLSDATRLRVLLMLADGELHVTAICAALGQSQPAVSHHLALLRHSDIITPRRAGKLNIYSLTEKGREGVEAARRAMAD